jgi:hypothetical protein
MNYRKIIKTMLPFVFFFVVSFAYAQADPNEDPDDQNAPLDAAPIGDYIVPMLLLGIATAFVLLKKRAAAKPL